MALLREPDFPAIAGTCRLCLWATGLQPAPKAKLHAFIDALQQFGLDFPRGGFESLAIHCDPQLKLRPNKPDFSGPVVRLHVGLKDPDDLIDDL